MKLIDAEMFRDELYNHFEFVKVDDYEVWAVVDVDEVLDNIEEVKAIPIEWIEKYIEEINIRDFGTIYIQPCGSITQMLKDWEKENGTI